MDGRHLQSCMLTSRIEFADDNKYFLLTTIAFLTLHLKNFFNSTYVWQLWITSLDNESLDYEWEIQYELTYFTLQAHEATRGHSVLCLTDARYARNDTDVVGIARRVRIHWDTSRALGLWPCDVKSFFLFAHSFSRFSNDTLLTHSIRN